VPPRDQKSLGAESAIDEEHNAGYNSDIADMKAQSYVGLESLALALIFAPEPMTTIVGSGLLAYAKYAKHRERSAARHRLALSIPYLYRVYMADRKNIAFHITATRPGQLPLTWPIAAKLYVKA